MIRRAPRILALGAILTALLPLPAAPADDPAPAAAPLRYRRVLVPREALTELTRGYLPMKRDEFAARMADIAAAASAAEGRAAWIASAEYTARFDAGHFVTGMARLHIVHTAAEPAYVALAPAKLAMGPATWQSQPAPRAATVGTDPAGNSVVLVTESGVLEYPWTLRGVASERGEYRFAVAVTAAPVHRLTIDIPDTHELLTDQGLIVGVDEAPPVAAQGETTVALRRWRVELGGLSLLELTVAPRESSSRRRRLVSVEQDSRYRLESDSVHVACDIDLDIHNQPLGELQLEADDTLQVTAVRLGNLDLDWQSLPGSDAAGQVIRIPFAERLTGTHSTLQVSAVAALQTQTSWRLPTLRPRQVLWRQGTMSLEVPDSLELRHLQVYQARQSAGTAPTDDSRSTTLQFELFGPESALEVVLARRTSDVVAETGTTIDMNAGAVTALVVADLHCRSGERFALQALVPNAWAVDGVEAEPAAAVHDYQFVAYEAQFKRLQIQLAQPLQPSRAVRLTIRAHRSPSVFLGPEDLRPVQWLAMTHTTRLVALVPDTNFRLDLSGDAALERLDPTGLAPADARRLQLRAGSLVFDDDERASRVAVTMAREEPEFAASVTVDVDVTQDALIESYRVVCTPDATPLERVQIHFSEPRAAELVWRWVGDEPGILSARRLREGAEEGAGLPLSGESWEIVLRTPQRSPFELRGQRTTAGSPPRTVSLATLPDAVSHDGQLTLRAKDGQRLSVQAQAVTPIPCDPMPPDAAPTPRACYRYDASKTARVTIQRLADGGGPAALWAWRCRVRAQRAPEGETRVAATYFLENTGVAELRVALPADSTCEGWDINGEPAPRALRTDGAGSYLVTLPAGQRFPRVEIRYACPGRPLGIWSEVSVELPRVDIPVLDRRVSLWLPPGYRPRPTATAAGHDPLPTWTQRLLGPLAARPGDDHASPTASSLWSRLTRSTAAVPDGAGPGTSFLEQLGSVVLAGQSESAREPRTWRMALSQCFAVGAQPSASVVWVDADLLAQEGFSLAATVPPPRGETPITAAGSVLRQAGLLLVVHRDKLYLTSSALAAWYPSPGEWLADGVLFVPRCPSPLTAELDRLEASDRRVPVPLPTWTAVPTLADSPWQRSDSRSHGDGPQSSGRWCDVSPDAATGRCTLRVERPAVLWAIGWCSLVGMAAGRHGRTGRLREPLAPRAPLVAGARRRRGGVRAAEPRAAHVESAPGNARRAATDRRTCAVAIRTGGGRRRAVGVGPPGRAGRGGVHACRGTGSDECASGDGRCPPGPSACRRRPARLSPGGPRGRQSGAGRPI
ncbi:MAG: hypothetical protein MUF48_01245 [Pirellulaceae bacterium]|nr:hypothetical protein [Pirellulaceae bacterium]